MKAGQNQTQIAQHLGRSKSTISRKVRRNRGLRGYRPRQAQQLCDSRSLESRDEEIKMIQGRLNQRPRKRLGFKTPHEVFHALHKPVALRD